MGFFAPLFLAGFAALAAPLYLHLLRRQTTNPRPFSSLMFFEARTQSSMRHRRLRYLWLLGLRLALLALLALAFANPFVRRPAASVTGNRLNLIVVDHSFSMQAGTRLARAKAQATASLASLRGPTQVLALGERLEVLTQPTTDTGALREAIQSIAPGWSHADFGNLARGVRAIAAASPTPVLLDLYSDLRRTSLPSSFSDLSLPGTVSVFLHPTVAGNQPNWTVESVKAPAQLWGSPKETKPARIEATIAGFNTPASVRGVSLLINGQVVASQNIAVPASGRAMVVFDSVVVPYGWTRGEVRLAPVAAEGASAADAFAADDSAVFTMHRTDPERVLFVHAAGDTRSPLYFGTALTSTDSGDAAFALDPVSAGAAGDRSPGNYALVVLSDVPSVPTPFAAALQRYVQAGGGVLIACGLATRELPFFQIEGTRNYAATPATTSLAGWQSIRFFFAAQAAEGGARVLARLDDQTPLILQKKIGEGEVELFASGFDNLTNDLPLNPTFVAFVRETAHFLAGDQQDATGARMVGSYLTLRTGSEQGVGLQVTDPSGRRPLSLAQAASAQSLPLEQQGFYQLQLADGRQQVVAVNPDRRESDLTLIPAETLKLWTGSGEGSAAAPVAAGGPSAPTMVPVSLWWYLMLILLFAAVAESVLAARYWRVRRDEAPERA